jgi:hypothetical protein
MRVPKHQICSPDASGHPAISTEFSCRGFLGDILAQGGSFIRPAEMITPKSLSRCPMRCRHGRKAPKIPTIHQCDCMAKGNSIGAIIAVSHNHHASVRKT